MILCHVSRCFIIRSNELHLRIRRFISSFPTLRLGFSTDAASYLAFAEPDDLQRKAMKVSHLNERALVGPPRHRFYRFSALLLAALLMVGCSTQPMTLDQELTATAVAGAIGAGSGAIFAASAHKGYPASIGIGVGGMAGFILIYEEIKREAAMESTPNAPPPIDNGATSPSNQNP
jgi:hypothetical protein